MVVLILDVTVMVVLVVVVISTECNAGPSFFASVCLKDIDEVTECVLHHARVEILFHN